MVDADQTPHGLLVGEQTVAGAVVLSVAGDLDMLSAPQLHAQVERVLRSRPAALVIDLLRVEFLGSAGIGVLVHAYNTAEQTLFAVVAQGAATQRPLHLLAIDTYIDVYSSVRAALDAMGMTHADVG